MAYDLTKVTVGSNGQVQLGPGQFVDSGSLSDAGYAAAVNYNSKKDGELPPLPNGGQSPAVLSSANGQKTADQVKTDIANENKNLSTYNASTANKKVSTANTSANGALPPEVQAVVDSSKTQEQKLKDDRDAAAKSVTDSYDSLAIANTEASKAFINSLTTTYQQTRAQLEQMNKENLAIFTQSGIRSGQARYAPELNSQMVDQEAKAGLAKLQDLDVKYQNAVAEANNALNTKNYALAKDKGDLILKLKESALKEFQDTQKAMLDLAEKARTYQFNVQKETTDIAKGLVGAPADVRMAVSNAKSLPEAVALAGDYLQSGTGIVGEYLFYKRQAEASGQTPLDFDSYQTVDANRKAKVAAAASGNGLSNSTLTKVQTIAGQFDSEQVVKDYNVTATQVNYIKDLGDKPTDDIARVYAFAKIMDPNSAVREGEYKTVQDYAQALFQSAGLKTKRVFDNAGFLTEEARGFINTTLNAKLQTQEKTYKNVYSEYGRRINKITGQGDGTDYITDYGKGYGDTATDLITKEADAKTSVIDYGKTNPKMQSQIKTLATQNDPDLGRPLTYAEIKEVLNIK